MRARRLAPDNRPKPFVHELKTWPEFYDALAAGAKRFEVRRDDRTPRFEEGHIARLREWDPTGGGYTGRQIDLLIGYVARSTCMPAGWCAFAVGECPF